MRVNTLWTPPPPFVGGLQFCIVSAVTMVLGLGVVVQRAHILLKTRLMLQHSLCAAWTDVGYVLAIASVINSLLGTVRSWGQSRVWWCLSLPPSPPSTRILIHIPPPKLLPFPAGSLLSSIQLPLCIPTREGPITHLACFPAVPPFCRRFYCPSCLCYTKRPTWSQWRPRWCTSPWWRHCSRRPCTPSPPSTP
jgi:hypothetical protein